MSYIYKILLNSLYGRFGINPKSTVTELCNDERYEHLLRNTKFTIADKLSNSKYHIVSYYKNTEKDDYWDPPRISAVQLSAAVTACSRIYMYPYISRDDCYYTDTDSIVIGKPLPEEDVSSTELGKFKLEVEATRGIFLAPKSYIICDKDGQNIIKQKGPLKAFATAEWFEIQYEHNKIDNIDKRDKIKEYENITSYFKVDFKKMLITTQDKKIITSSNRSNKRNHVYDPITGDWIDTDPVHVEDYYTKDNQIKVLEYKLNKMTEKVEMLKKDRIQMDNDQSQSSK